MKKIIAIVSVAAALIMTGCVEHRYYTTHHRHSERYYYHHPHRHPHVDVEIHN